MVIFSIDSSLTNPSIWSSSSLDTEAPGQRRDGLESRCCANPPCVEKARAERVEIERVREIPGVDQRLCEWRRGIDVYGAPAERLLQGGDYDAVVKDKL